MKIERRNLLIALFFSLNIATGISGCIFPAGWYDPGILVRITALHVSPSEISSIEELISSKGYTFYGERTANHMEREVRIRDYKKGVHPSQKNTPPYVYIMFWIDQNKLTINVSNMYGREDTAIETEIDSIGVAIYDLLINLHGTKNVKKEKLTTGPPII